MITIPTVDMTGILSDVIPFAYPDAEVANEYCVRLEWDGKQLHALATDGYRVGISTYDPDDLPTEDAQDSLFTKWGSGDEPWTAILALHDAKELVKVFKLGPKQGQTPLTVDFDTDLGRLKVARHRDTGLSALTAVMATVLVEFPDVRTLMLRAELRPGSPPKEIGLNAQYLADFAKVRPRGPLRMRFAGANRLVRVSIGERFTGAIMPVLLRDLDKPEQVELAPERSDPHGLPGM